LIELASTSISGLLDRQGGSPTVENGLTLDLNRLIRQRDILPGRHISGSLVWSEAQSGDKIASIDFEASLISEGHVLGAAALH
jgi:hypothetical protein